MNLGLDFALLKTREMLPDSHARKGPAYRQ